MICACGTLCLDVHHRKVGDTEADRGRNLIDQALTALRSKEDDELAIRGVRLIDALLRSHCGQLPETPGPSAVDSGTDWPSVASEDFQCVRPENQSRPALTEHGATQDREQVPFDIREDVFDDLSWINVLTENYLDNSWFDPVATLDN